MTIGPADPVYVVDIEADEAVALRTQPAIDAPVLAELLAGQLVARLDEDERGEWWRVFADTPGEGAYVGYASARYLRHWILSSRTSGGGSDPDAAE